MEKIWKECLNFSIISGRIAENNLEEIPAGIFRFGIILEGIMGRFLKDNNRGMSKEIHGGILTGTTGITEAISYDGIPNF